MKTKSLFTILLFAVFFFTSCQEEVMEIVQPSADEALVAKSELTNLISKTAIKDGSSDNILDKSSCTTIELPVTVSVNGLEIIVDSVEDYAVIEAIFDQFDDDDDYLEFIFPIKIILSDYTEIEINNQEELETLIEDCVGENEEDEDIECIDFKYPISFSAYDTEFQIIDVITIENDEQLHKFIKRVREGEIFASLNFPVEMILASGEIVEVNDNKELQEVIDAAKDACDEDDDNDYGDDDFTKERLDNLLKSCPWLVYEFERNSDNLNNHFIDYAMSFKDDNVVKVRTHDGELISGTWETEITEDGALLTLELGQLEAFTLEWIVYELEPGKIKFFKEGGNRVILKKNCDIQVDFSPEMIENYLQECLWRITRLSVDGIDHEKDYIGTPLKFLDNNLVKIRVNGEFVEGTYEVTQKNIGNVLTIQLEGRPNLQIAWLVTFLRDGVMKLENQTSKMVMEWLCPNTDGDVIYVEEVLMDGAWEVAAYESNLGSNLTTESFFGYSLEFRENGKILVTDPNNGESRGAWLAYRKEGLNLGLKFGDEFPFAELTHRWKIKEINEERIELKDYNSNGEIERIVVLEKKRELGFTKDEIEGYLQECMWRVSRLKVDGIDHEREYIGTPLKFFGNGSVKIRINGEWIQGEYDILEKNFGFVLQIYLEDRPNLRLEWLITSIENGVMTLENEDSAFVMEWLCNGVEEVQGILVDGQWEVAGFESEINSNIRTESFFGYTLDFFESGKILITDPNNGESKGSWLAYNIDGPKLGLKFGDEFPFSELTHRWVINDISENRIELKDYNSDGGIERILVLEKKVDHGITTEEIEAYLQECHWRVTKLFVDEVFTERDYIGTPMKFMPNNGIMIRVKGEWIQGTYEVIEMPEGFYLQIFLDDRPNLRLWWKITFLEDGIIEMENENNQFVMEQHCQDSDEDLMYVLDVLVSFEWEVAAFESVHETEVTTDSFFGYTMNFIENGRVEVTNPNEVVSHVGSWLNYRRNGLYLGMLFGDELPFAELTHRWKIGEISPNRIELKDFAANGELERVIILEAKN